MSEKEKPVITVTYSGPWRVMLNYFKADTGKFYTDAEWTSEKLQLWEIWGELKEMFRKGIRPGLVNGACKFIVQVDVPEHPHNHPTLIMPSETM